MDGDMRTSFPEAAAAAVAGGGQVKQTAGAAAAQQTGLAAPSFSEAEAAWLELLNDAARGLPVARDPGSEAAPPPLLLELPAAVAGGSDMPQPPPLVPTASVHPSEPAVPVKLQ